MSLNDEERKSVVTLEYEKANLTYSKIEVLVREEMWDFVANRLYYASFHAVLALLVNDGHRVVTHRGMGAMFGLHYVKEGIFSQDEGRMLSRLQGLRDEADYNCAFTTTKEEIEPYIERVGKFIKKIRTHLSVLDDISTDKENKD